MEFGSVLFLVISVIGSDAWILAIHPRDIFLPKNATLEANCTINEASSINPSDVEFVFIVDGKYFNESHVYYVPHSHTKILNNFTVHIKHDVHWPKFKNSRLVCKAGLEIVSSLVTLGEFPHTIANISCIVNNWTQMNCTAIASGTNEIFTTKLNYHLRGKTSSKTMNVTVDQMRSLDVENIFKSFSLDDILVINVHGSNYLGNGVPSYFEMALKDLVKPGPAKLSIQNGTRNDSISLLLASLVHDKEYMVFLEVNCSNALLPYKLEVERNSFDNNGEIVINLPENDLPPSQNCFAFSMVKPRHYGIKSDPSNNIFFNTSDRVPLQNPECFNSSFKVHECSSTMICTIDVYFKTLSKAECQGAVIEYRATLMRNNKVLNVSYHANKGTPFVTITGLLLSHDDKEDFMVKIEAATEAGYNTSINTKPVLIDGSIDYYLPFLPIELSSSLEYLFQNKNLPPQLLLYLVAVNDSRANIIMQSEDNIQNIFVVWCLFDKLYRSCQDKFGWQRVIDLEEVIEFIAPSGSTIGEYMFGMQVESGLQWMDNQCFFVMSDSKPKMPSFNGTILTNETHIMFYLDKPQCSHNEKVTFPGAYFVEYFHAKRSDESMNKSFNYFENPIVLNVHEAGIYYISVCAMPWNKEGQCSDRMNISHTFKGRMSSWTSIIIVLLFITIILGVIVIYTKKKWPKKFLKIEVPNKQHETTVDCNNYILNGNTSGYKICPKEDMEVKMGSYNYITPRFTSNKLSSGTHLGSNFNNSEQCDSYVGKNSSGYKYAVTKWINHPIYLMGEFTNNPSRITKEIVQELPDPEGPMHTESDGQHGLCSDDGKDASSDSNLPDYPAVKIIMSSSNSNESFVFGCPDERIIEKRDVAENNSNNTESENYANEVDMVSCDEGSNDYDVDYCDNFGDIYCKMSNLKNLPIVEFQT